MIDLLTRDAFKFAEGGERPLERAVGSISTWSEVSVATLTAGH